MILNDLELELKRQKDIKSDKEQLSLKKIYDNMQYELNILNHRFNLLKEKIKENSKK